jgi:hypothetical protein
MTDISICLAGRSHGDQRGVTGRRLSAANVIATGATSRRGGRPAFAGFFRSAERTFVGFGGGAMRRWYSGPVALRSTGFVPSRDLQVDKEQFQAAGLSQAARYSALRSISLLPLDSLCRTAVIAV